MTQSVRPRPLVVADAEHHGGMSARVAAVLDQPLASYLIVMGCTTLLLGLGVVMVFSASSVIEYADTGSAFGIVARQLMWAAVGVPAMLLASRMPVRTWRILALPALIGSLALLALVMVPGIGVAVNGNRNWINIGGPFRLQPSEAAKLALILYAADVLARKRKLLDTWRHLLIPVLPAALAVVALVLAEDDLGTAVIIVMVTLVVLFVTGAPMRLFVLLGGAAIAMVTYLSVSATHRSTRFTDWLHPNQADPTSTGWQALHGKYALGSGGWWGLGLGAGREKWGALPEAHTDFIFAVIGEELGLIGTLTVLALFGLLAYAGIRIALRCGDPFVRLAAAGITVWITGQALINIGAVLGLLPIAGLPLPLVSYGGSALLVTLVALGVLMSLARSEPGAAEALAAHRAHRRDRMRRAWAMLRRI
ncbi:MAG TPA: putative lipid II flippase FtsW [Actinomycetes bacterium]|nr:putative lipid II flippase FtsW [Actinomycetes bacterium]